MSLGLFRLRLAELLRPLVAALPRGSSFAYRILLGPTRSSFRGDAHYRNILRKRNRVFFDHHIGAYIVVDLTDWACRAHYFRGRYYDNLVPLLIDTWLKHEGLFLDVGANRGLHALYAAQHLSANGQVYAFEPQPETFSTLKAHLTINGISNCLAYNLGLSDVETTLRLNSFADEHSGTCSFLNVATIARTTDVPVRRLDSIVGDIDLSQRVLLKIDTEGFEYKVLLGAGKLLDHPNMIIACEITDEWLKLTGSSQEQLFNLMASHGYRAYLPNARFQRFIKLGLILKPLDAPLQNNRQYDVVFARKDIMEDQ